jgi:hypothetical protein
MPDPLTDAQLRARFEDGSLPAEEFDHAAHVRVARACLRELGLSAGARRFVEGLRRFTARNGVPHKYHDTLTHALLHLIYAEMVHAPEQESFAGFRQRCPRLFTESRALLERHYSPGLLDSPAARAHYAEPDREPLPQGAAARAQER